MLWIWTVWAPYIHPNQTYDTLARWRVADTCTNAIIGQRIGTLSAKRKRVARRSYHRTPCETETIICAISHYWRFESKVRSSLCINLCEHFTRYESLKGQTDTRNFTDSKWWLISWRIQKRERFDRINEFFRVYNHTSQQVQNRREPYETLNRGRRIDVKLMRKI